MRTPPLLAPAAVAVLLFCAACSTAPNGANPPLVASLPALQPQPSSQDVERLWGPPDQKIRGVNKDSSRELWTYRRLIQQHTKQEAVATEDVPFVDPITGQMRTITEPIYRDRRIETYEILELTFQEGLLVDWKREIKRSSGFY